MEELPTGGLRVYHMRVRQGKLLVPLCRCLFMVFGQRWHGILIPYIPLRFLPNKLE